MLQALFKDAEDRMHKAIAALRSELGKIRTGRAHPSLLDHITVNYYGNETPLSQVASITASDARTLTITPWEKTLVPAIEKAIMTSDLGLNPATSGPIIRVPMPPLNEQRRRELVKVVKEEGENAKIAIRNIRRDANNHIKELLKDKSITEDEARKGEDNIQKSTDKLIAEVDQVVAAKEAELMEV